MDSDIDAIACLMKQMPQTVLSAARILKWCRDAQAECYMLNPLLGGLAGPLLLVASLAMGTQAQVQVLLDG